VLPAETGLDFPDEAYVDTDGSRLAMRSHWTRDGADALLVVDEMRAGDGWREMRRMRLVRTAPAG
jgi:hypothetical protein